MVAGNAPTARWEFDVVVRECEGEIDFGGPVVRGKRGDRHIGLAWGELPGARDGLRMAHIVSTAGTFCTLHPSRRGRTAAKLSLSKSLYFS